MKKYDIEYKYNLRDVLVLIVVTELKSDSELIDLCDHLYDVYIDDNNEVRFYFFNSKYDATDYVYFIKVANKPDEDAVTESSCIGHLVGESLTARLSPPEIIKRYNNPKK